MPLMMTRRAADRLDQRAFGTQKTFLVRVQDRHQTPRGYQALAQQVDADQHVELAEAQIADDLHPLDGIDIGMQVAHSDSILRKIIREVFGQPLGQHRHQYPLTRADPPPRLPEQIVDLRDCGANLDHRVDQAGGARQLLHHLP